MRSAVTIVAGLVAGILVAIGILAALVFVGPPRAGLQPTPSPEPSAVVVASPSVARIEPSSAASVQPSPAPSSSATPASSSSAGAAASGPASSGSTTTGSPTPSG